MRTLLLSDLHSNHETAGEVIFRRVDYPVDRARKRIREAGLPGILEERLQRGV